MGQDARYGGFLSDLAPYDGSYWSGVTVQEEAFPTPQLEETPAAPSAKEPEAHEEQTRRCRTHQRWKNPPPLRSCILCRLVARKA
jgi:hypothetical protein